MPERIYTYNSTAPGNFPTWSSLWAGTLTFVAIWSIFGFLGAAIFATLAAPSGSFAGLGIGMGFWAVVLTVVAMLGAGYVTGSLSGKLEPIRSGSVLFGLSVVAALIVDYIARLSMGFAGTGGALTAGWTAGLGWIAFVALILGWMAAVGGIWSGMSRSRATQVTEETRRVA